MGFAMNDLDIAHQLSRFRLHNDHDAFQVLYNVYEQRIWGMILARGVSHETAPDVFQKVCMSMADYLAKKEVPPEQLPGTVFTITKRKIADAFRGRLNNHLSMDKLLEDGADFPEEDRTVKALECRDLFEKTIEEAGVNEVQKETLLLHYLLGYKHKDIASLTGVPVATVKSRIYNGKKAVRELLTSQEVHP